MLFVSSYVHWDAIWCKVHMSDRDTHRHESTILPFGLCVSVVLMIICLHAVSVMFRRLLFPVYSRKTRCPIFRKTSFGTALVPTRAVSGTRPRTNRSSRRTVFEHLLTNNYTNNIHHCACSNTFEYRGPRIGFIPDTSHRTCSCTSMSPSSSAWPYDKQ